MQSQRFSNAFCWMLLPSVLWHCWLSIRKSIQPVKIEWWVVDVVSCLERGADCLHMVQLMPLLPKTLSSFASFKSRLVLPLCYWLTQVIPEKRALNGCSSSSSSSVECCTCLPSTQYSNRALYRHRCSMGCEWSGDCRSQCSQNLSCRNRLTAPKQCWF